jgi:type II secretory pathway pseudopilin PulG
MRLGSQRGTHRGHGGFTYVIVLALIAVLGIGLAALGPLFAEETRREREDELLRIGQLYAEAIARYYKASPGSARSFPPSLDVLLTDTRFVGTVRHLRTLYADPVGAGEPWGLVRAPDGGIRGVYSQSALAPLRQAPVELGAVTLAPAARYSEWQFVARIE